MAVYTDAAGERLSRSANLPSGASVTISGWSRIRADRGASVVQPIVDLLSAEFAGFYLLWEGDASVQGETAWLQTVSAGGVLGAGAAFASRPAAGDWFYWWIRCSGTGAGQLEAGWRSLGSDTWVTVSNTAPAFTPATLGISDLGAAGAYWSNTAYAHMRCWDRVLSNAELLAESKSTTPVSATNLNFAWLLDTVGNLGDTDLSANNREPTVTGTLGTEASPALDTAYTLVVADSTHGHTAESPTLSQELTLSVADSLHGHTADAVTLDVGLAGGTAVSGLTNGWLMTATASDAVGGSSPYTYQWQRSARGAGSWSNITGQTTRTLVDRTVTADTDYDYRLRYTDDDSSTVYSNVLQVDVPAYAPVWTIVGDSQTDEYRADDDRGAGDWEDYALNWLEQLAEPSTGSGAAVNDRDLNVGTWGTRSEPRRTGFANNWARSGATMTTLLSDQLAAAAAQVSGGTSTHAVLFCTANEWVNPFYDEFYADDIYNGDGTDGDSGTPVATIISTVLGQITDAIDAFVTANVAGMVVMTPSDYFDGPMFHATYSDATRRGYVSTAIASLHSQVESYAATVNAAAGATVVSVIEQDALFSDIWASDDGTHVTVAGVELDYTHESDNEGPLYFAMAPTGGIGVAHAGTIVQAVYANTFIQAANDLQGISITALTDAEILENAGLTVLSVADSVHGHTAESPTLSISFALIVGDSLHAHSAGSVDLTQAGTLAVNDSTHAHSADALDLTQANVLAVSDSLHGQLADAVTLVQQHVLAVDGSSHAHTAESVSLSQGIALAVADALHSHIADGVALSQAHTLLVADASHAQSVDNLDLLSGLSLTVSDASHAHTAESVELTQANVLSVADSAHGHMAGSPTLVQAHILSVDDAAHGHTVANIELSQAIMLAVAEALHAQSADSPTLTQAHVLAVASALHLHAADVVSLTQAGTLIVDDALHAQLADALELRLPGDDAGRQVFVIRRESQVFMIARHDRAFTVH